MSELDKNILKTISEKTAVKQQVFATTKVHFEGLKNVLKNFVDQYSASINKIDSRVELSYHSKEKYDARLKIGGDTLLFHMHTNVFSFDNTHRVWQSSYVNDDPSRAYCGMINVYNFLSDSFKFNRVNDSGYLIARIFINKDNHFFVEGKKRLSFRFNNFEKEIIGKDIYNPLLLECIDFALNFELLSPPYQAMTRISIKQINALTKNTQLTTDKRLGFKFKSEIDVVNKSE